MSIIIFNTLTEINGELVYITVIYGRGFVEKGGGESVVQWFSGSVRSIGQAIDPAPGT